MDSKIESEEINYTSLLDLKIEDENIQKIINIFPDLKKKIMGKYTYLNLIYQGVSLCFYENILQQIYFYNEGIQNFKQFKGVLPLNINFQMKNKNIVEYLGDTKKKGGGSCPIWLSYDHLGFEVTFMGNSWADLENPITHLCIFTKEKSEINCSTCLKSFKSLSNSCKCGVVNYCSSECKNAHINFHLKYCK
jgi:hypothetical protein